MYKTFLALNGVSCVDVLLRNYLHMHIKIF